MSPLVEAWRMSQDANLFLLKSLPAAALEDRYGARTRDVRAQFKHMHDVRLRWMKHAAPDLAKGLEGFERDATPTRAQLKKALVASGKLVETYLEQCAKTGKVKAWKGPPESFLCYLVAHEAHHRGLAMVAMRTAGRKLPQEIVYGQWDWGKTRSQRG